MVGPRKGQMSSGVHLILYIDCESVSRDEQTGQFEISRESFVFTGKFAVTPFHH